MATYSLTTSPTTIDDGTSYLVQIVNSGAATVTLSRGGTLRPGQLVQVYPEGTALTAASTSAVAGQVTTSATAAKPLPNASDPATLAANAAFTGTYASAYSSALIGNRWVPLGDSTTIGSDTTSALTPGHGEAWTTYASVLSGQKLWLVRNAGIAGNTSAQMLARFDTDVTPYAPRLVTILAGRNDISQSVPLATFQANVAALIAKCRAIGAVPVLCTITPTTSTAGQTTLTWNAWLRFYANAQGLPLVDFHELLVDPATGNYLSAYNGGDNVHPNNAGYAAMGALANTVLSPMVKAWAPILPLYQTDTDNLINLFGDGLFTSISQNGNGESSSWNIANPSSVTASVVTGDTAIKGNWKRLTFSASAAQVQLYKNRVTSEIIAGHVYALSARVKTNLSAGSVQVLLQLNSASGSGGNVYARALSSTTQPISNGRVWITATAPADVNGWNPQVLVSSGATGTVDVAQFGVYDLTAMGLAALAA